MGDALLRDLWFPNAEGVLIEDVVVDDELVVVRANASVERAECPACGTLSGFAEQADGLTFRHGRRSAGLQAVLQRLAVMLAGRAGARLAHALAVRASQSTLLRLIHRRPACQAHRTDVTAHAVNARSCPVDSAGRRPTHQPASPAAALPPPSPPERHASMMPRAGWGTTRMKLKCRWAGQGRWGSTLGCRSMCWSTGCSKSATTPWALGVDGVERLHHQVADDSASASVGFSCGSASSNRDVGMSFRLATTL